MEGYACNPHMNHFCIASRVLAFAVSAAGGSILCVCIWMIGAMRIESFRLWYAFKTGTSMRLMGRTKAIR